METQTSKDVQTTQLHKERRGMDSQYFIHGYEVQRMFGYAEKSDLVSYFMNRFC